LASAVNPACSSDRPTSEDPEARVIHTPRSAGRGHPWCPTDPAFRLPTGSTVGPPRSSYLVARPGAVDHEDSPARIGSEQMNIRRTGATVVSLVIAASLCAGCSTTSSGGTPPSSTVAVPSGWKTYAYGKAKISVPSNWAAVSDYTCPDTVSPGVLYLGPSKNPGDSCPAYPRIDTVTVTPLQPLPAGASYPSLCSLKMNGLVVFVEPCTSSNPGGIVIYSIPSLGVRAEGTGTSSENVTGSGTGTVVGRVLHTLRAKGS